MGDFGMRAGGDGRVVHRHTMGVRKQLLFSYLAAAAIVAAPIVATPFYAVALGARDWGLVAFVLLMQLICLLFDQGFSQGLVKELTEARVHNPGALEGLVRRLERCYWGLSMLLAAGVLAVSPLLVRHLASSGVPPDRTYPALCLAAAWLAVQLPGSLHKSVLASLEWHVQNAQTTTVAQVIRHGGAMCLLVIAPHVELFLAWQVAVAGGEAALRRSQARRGLRELVRVVDGPMAPATIRLVPVLQRCGQMSLAVLLGGATVYLDRVIVAGALSAESLGIYTLASTAAVGGMQAIYPICQIALPRLIAARSRPEEVKRINRYLTLGIAGVVVLLATVFVGVGDRLLAVWLRSDRLVGEVTPLLHWLLLGSVLNAFYNIGYLNWLAQGRHGTILRIYAFCLFCGLVVLPWLVTHHGLQGAAAGWVLTNAVSLAFSLGWLFGPMSPQYRHSRIGR